MLPQGDDNNWHTIDWLTSQVIKSLKEEEEDEKMEEEEEEEEEMQCRRKSIYAKVHIKKWNQKLDIQK